MSKNIIIRPIKIEDASAIHVLRGIEEVAENLLGMPSARLPEVENFIKNLSERDHAFVAEITKDGFSQVVGMASLHVHKSQRCRHCAGLGMMVLPSFQGKGIGRQLLKVLLDLADNWLMLKRVELDVFTDNQKAIKLYESCGFVVEGKRQIFAVRRGEYCDTFMMARCSIP